MSLRRNRKLSIIADENIPFLDELLLGIADITFLPGRKITHEDLLQADILLVRSVTQVNSKLLSGTSVKFVGSCTIGTDHVDLAYLESNNIAFANAPGCNADAVVDYVIAAMFHCYPEADYWQGKSVGIVGMGSVGGRLAKRLDGMGVSVMCYDPFKSEASHSYQQVLSADLISFHVPLTYDTEFPTYHMLGSKEISQIHSNAVVINSCRGPVFEKKALQMYFDNTAQKERFKLVLDVYEDEPCPQMSFLQELELATAHIAGYSFQGKLRGSIQVLEAMIHHLDLGSTMPDLLSRSIDSFVSTDVVSITDLIRSGYDIKLDSNTFLKEYNKAKTTKQQSEAFDIYRKNYPVRTEFSFQKRKLDSELKDVGVKLGFTAQI